MKKLTLLITVATSMISCSERDNYFFVREINPKRAELRISTRAFTGNPLGRKEIYFPGDEIGIYLSNHPVTQVPPDGCSYNNLKVSAVNDSHGNLYWHIEPPLYVDAHPVRLYAYSPYRPAYGFPPATIPLTIAFDASRTPDYRYGSLTSGHRRVDHLSPIAQLSMKHALVTLSFRIRSEEEIGQDMYLEAIQVGNKAGGSLWNRKALLDICTGDLATVPSSTGATRLTLGQVRLTPTGSSGYEIRVLPLSRPAEAEEIEFRFTINQRTYSCFLPPNTCWKRGYKYVYEITFNGEHLSLKQTIHPFI